MRQRGKSVTESKPPIGRARSFGVANLDRHLLRRVILPQPNAGTLAVRGKEDDAGAFKGRTNVRERASVGRSVARLKVRNGFLCDLGPGLVRCGFELLLGPTQQSPGRPALAPRD
jgi:hypothetical protein